jgi:hypothetical protein
MAEVTLPALARIYVLADPRTSEIRYVGMTTRSLRTRLAAHLRDHRRDTYRSRWINAVLEAGVKPVIIEIEIVPADDRSAAERKWIAYYRAAGANLVNATDGGEGTLGRKLTPEQRQIVGEAARRRFQDPQARKAVSLVHKGKTISAEHRRVVGEAATRRWAEYRGSGGAPSEESRARLSAAARVRKPREWTPESRAKLAESKRKAWAELKASGDDIVLRQRMRDGIARSSRGRPRGPAS